MNKEGKNTKKSVNPIGSLVTGRFLVSKSWAKNWPFMIYLSLLALLMIASSHSADRKVHRLEKLRTEMKELNSEYIDTKSHLMQESMETKVVERASELGLLQSRTPPFKIVAPSEIE